MNNDKSRYPESKAGGATLLAHMGFADKDRANPRHDLAVAYARSNVASLRERIFPGLETSLLAAVEAEYEINRAANEHNVVFDIEELRCSTHKEGRWVPAFVPPETWELAKTHRTHIIELRSIVGSARDLSEALRSDFLAEELVVKPYASSFAIGFADAVIVWTQYKAAILEVKITPCSAGDVIRQIEMYRGGITRAGAVHLGNARAVLLCDFAISPAEKQALESKNIMPMRLGPGFEEFVRAQSQTKAELEAF
jgi:hypothetical protein